MSFYKLYLITNATNSDHAKLLWSAMIIILSSESNNMNYLYSILQNSRIRR